MLKSNIKFLAALLGLTVAFSSGSALAQYNTAGSEKAASPAIIAAVSSSTASVTAGGISSAIGGGFGGGFVSAGSQTANLRRYGSGASGLGAAAQDKLFGVWINGGYTRIENDFINTKMDGNSFIGMLGLDYRVESDLVVGLVGGAESVDLNTAFNFGTIKTKGFQVGPYLSYVISPMFNLDAFVTRSWLNTDVTRSNGSITGSYDSARWLAVTNLNAKLPLDTEFTLYPQIGYLYVHQKDDGYTESNASAVEQNFTSLGQGRVGAKLGYNLGDMEPYVGARYQYNFINPTTNLQGIASPSNDKDGVNLQLGLNFRGLDGLSGSLEGNYLTLQDDITQYGITGSLKMSF